MPLTTFMGVLTLAPAVFALLVLGVGLARYPRAPLVVGLAAIGTLVPAVCLPFLVQALSGGDLIQLTPLFGGVIGPDAWVSPAYRLDGFGVFAAYGAAFIVTPLLLWLALHGDIPVLVEKPAAAETADAAESAGAGAGADDAVPMAFEPRGGLMQRVLAPAQWGGVALALGIESAALTLVFSDNVLWLAFAWIVLAVLAWALGEMGSDAQTLDRAGLATMLAGPIVWLIAFLLPALAHQTPRTVYPSLAYMMGRGGTSPAFVLILGVALAVAAGCYPFTVWVRRRAALITPAGLAVIVLLLLPVALFVGARSYVALQDASSMWPQIGAARPPITAGVLMALLGALTTATAGLLALGRRDGRSLIALLAASQAGWGLFGLGSGTPAGALGVTLLLATSVLGLGAMLAALYAGGALLSDIEPEATGPRPLGAPLRPLHLAAWCIGALTLVGAPLFAGFAPRQIISAGTLQARGLGVPLNALAWVGDALLLLALLRATAPAFAAAFAQKPAADETDAEARPASGLSRMGLDGAGLPGAVLALLALIVGIVPQALLAIGGTLAASALVQSGTPTLQLKTAQMGYTASGAQWLPVLGWSVLALVGVLLAFVLRGAPRERRSVVLDGQRVHADELAARSQAVGLADPEDAWADLRRAFESEWVQPGGRSLRGAEAAETAEAGDVETEADDFEAADAETAGAEMDEAQVAGIEGADVEIVEPAAVAAPADAVPETGVAAPDGAVDVPDEGAEPQVTEPEVVGPEVVAGPAGETAGEEPQAAEEPADDETDDVAPEEPAAVNGAAKPEAPAQKQAARPASGGGEAAFMMKPRQPRSGSGSGSGGGKRGGRKGGR